MLSFENVDDYKMIEMTQLSGLKTKTLPNPITYFVYHKLNRKESQSLKNEKLKYLGGNNNSPVGYWFSWLVYRDTNYRGHSRVCSFLTGEVYMLLHFAVVLKFC